MNTTESTSPPLRIVSLIVENVKRLKAVEIHPDGSLVVVAGRNGQGKSSVLDSIMYALAGKSSLPERPVRDGTSKATIELDLGEFIVKRTITAGGGTLTIQAHDGMKFPSPQTILDQSIGSLSFDPLAFAQMDRKAQLETLKSLVGLDFTELDRQRAALYDQRTQVNREVTRLRAQSESAITHTGLPDEELNLGTLMEELDAAQVHNRRNEATRQAAGRATTNLAYATNQAVSLEQHIKELRAKLAAAENELLAKHNDVAVATVNLAQLKQEVDALTDQDEAAIRQRIASAGDTNRKIRENKEVKQLRQSLNARTMEADRLTNDIEAIDRQKAEQLAAARFPMPSLSFNEEGVLLEGKPFSQGSSAEQLRASLAIGLALNPKIRVILIRQGALLDDDSMKLVAQLAAEQDAQVWIERVGNDAQASVIIEDGEVRDE